MRPNITVRRLSHVGCRREKYCHVTSQFVHPGRCAAVFPSRNQHRLDGGQGECHELQEILPGGGRGIRPAAIRSIHHVRHRVTARRRTSRACRPVDSTDFYLFNSYEAGRDGYVTLLANYIPLQQPYGGPNYFAMDPSALYEIHIDNDGDAKENLTFQFRFNNRLANDNRGIKLNIAGPNVAVPLKNVGAVSAADNSALNFRESYQVWVMRGDRRLGQAAQLTGEQRRHGVRQAVRLRRHQDLRQRRRLQGLRELVHLHGEHPGLHHARPRVRGPAQGRLRGEPRPGVRPRELRAGGRRQRAGRR